MAKYVKGGKILPLGGGFGLVKGDHPNKVDDVDIGPNNKNGLSVNHGEILQQKGNTLRVFSAEPMFGGISPTQLLYGGLAPDKVFAMQEQYKRVNRIADDGSRYQTGGEHKKRNAIAYGDNVSTRLRYLNLDKKLVAYINHIAKQYGISPAVLANRISEEGVVDNHIQYLDRNRDKKGESLLEHIYSSGYLDYGLDDAFTYHEKGKLNLRRKIPFSRNVETNEHGRPIESVYVHSPYDGIELVGATLEYFKNQLKNKFPKLEGKDLDTAITKAYRMGLNGAINDISKNGVGTRYKLNDGYYNINYDNDIYLQNKNNINKINPFTLKEQEEYLDSYVNANNEYIDRLRERNEAAIYPTKDVQLEYAKKHALKDFNERDSRYSYPFGTDYTYNNPFANVNFSFKFGGQTNINSLGERPNAKYGKQMKNKRRKSQFGLYGDFSGNKTYWYKDPNTGIMMPRLGLPFEIGDKYKTPSIANSTVNDKVVVTHKPKLTEYNTQMFHKGTPQQYTVDGNSLIGIAQKALNVEGNKQTQSVVPKNETVPFNNKWLGSADMYDAIGAGINILGSVASNMINRRAINNLRFTDRQYVLKDPVKLKTQINIKPQLAQLNDIRSKLFKSALASSGSSRSFYNRLLEGHDRMTASLMNLHGQKENQETQLINQDLLNQQGVRHANVDTVMNTVNANISGNDQLNNTQRMLHAQNNIGAITNIAGAIAGERGYLARREARIKDINDTVAATLPYYKEFKSMVQDGTIDDYYKWIAAMRNRGRLV